MSGRKSWRRHSTVVTVVCRESMSGDDVHRPDGSKWRGTSTGKGQEHLFFPTKEVGWDVWRKGSEGLVTSGHLTREQEQSLPLETLLYRLWRLQLKSFRWKKKYFYGNCTESYCTHKYSLTDTNNSKDITSFVLILTKYHTRTLCR